MKTEKLIKVLLAVLLLICLLKMPYGYYELVRFVALIGFAVLAYFSYKLEQQTEMIVFIALAVLFQPMFKIALGRELWNVVDVVVAVGLVISLFLNSKKNE
jgi:hypothetical protein